MPPLPGSAEEISGMTELKLFVHQFYAQLSIDTLLSVFLLMNQVFLSEVCAKMQWWILSTNLLITSQALLAGQRMTTGVLLDLKDGSYQEIKQIKSGEWLIITTPNCHLLCWLLMLFLLGGTNGWWRTMCARRGRPAQRSSRWVGVRRSSSPVMTGSVFRCLKGVTT